MFDNIIHFHEFFTHNIIENHFRKLLKTKFSFIATVLRKNICNYTDDVFFTCKSRDPMFYDNRSDAHGYVWIYKVFSYKGVQYDW